MNLFKHVMFLRHAKIRKLVVFMRLKYVLVHLSDFPKDL